VAASDIVLVVVLVVVPDQKYDVALYTSLK
jgi:hypothetical protein